MWHDDVRQARPRHPMTPFIVAGYGLSLRSFDRAFLRFRTTLKAVNLCIKIANFTGLLSLGEADRKASKDRIAP
jgi:hypothetical protein